jgi:hypothetical protein
MNAEKARIETQKCEKEMKERKRREAKRRFKEALDRIQSSVESGRYCTSLYTPRYMDHSVKRKLERLGYVVEYNEDERYSSVSWEKEVRK